MGRTNIGDGDGRPDFDPFELPADVTKAEYHLMATRIAKPQVSANSIPPEKLGLPKKAESLDPASMLPIDNELIPICVDTEELSFLSPGYPLYCQYIKFCILIGIFILAFSGIFNLKTSFEGDNCIQELPKGTTADKINDFCIKNFITEMSLANKVQNRENLEKQEIYNFFTILILLMSFQFMRKIQLETALICDERDLTASDFTVLVRNFPRDFDDNVDVDEQVELFFRGKGLPGHQLNVQAVSCCYDCSEKLVIIEKLNEMGVKKTKLTLESEKKFSESIRNEIQDLSMEMTKLKDELVRISREFEDGKGMVSKFTGEAYITLSSEQEVAAVLKHWEMGIFKHIKERWFKSHSPYKHRGYFLEVREAPEPSNVNWKNSGVSDLTRYKRRLATFLGSSLLLIGSAYFIIYVNEYSSDISTNLLTAQGSGSGKSAEDTAALLMLISSGASIVIVVINMILKIILEIFSEYEAYSTLAEQQSSYAFKLAVSQFLNTSIVTLGVCMWAHNYWGPGGLIEAMYTIFYFNAFIPWIVDILDFPYLMKVYFRYKFRREGPKVLMCQKDLNTFFENPIFDFPTKYAVYTKTICSAAFFAPLIPMAMVWAVVGLIGSYWIDKYIMLRRRARIGSVGEELAFEFLNHLEFVTILFAAGNFFFYKELSGFTNKQLALSIFGFTIGILNTLLPGSLNDFIFPKKDMNLSSRKYWEVKYYLVEDYDRANPATQEVAKKKFLEEVDQKPIKF